MGDRVIVTSAMYITRQNIIKNKQSEVEREREMPNRIEATQLRIKDWLGIVKRLFGNFMRVVDIGIKKKTFA